MTDEEMHQFLLDKGYIMTHHERYTFSPNGEKKAFEIAEAWKSLGRGVRVETTTIGTAIEYEEFIFVPFGDVTQ